jgi:hypothetical protein
MSETKQEYQLKNIKRDANGLIEGINYVFDENGLVNWRAMVKPEYIVPNKQKTQETDITKLEDKDLLILLQGTKELAFLRGFTDVSYSVIAASPTYCCISCRINWKPNYETEGSEVRFESIGDAHYDNTDSFAKNFLAAIAENRAFVRCVRNFLRINVVSKEEVSEGKQPSNNGQSNGDKPSRILQETMDEHGITFTQLKDKMIKAKVAGAEEFKTIEDIPADIKLNYISRIKDAYEKKKK